MKDLLQSLPPAWMILALVALPACLTMWVMLTSAKHPWRMLGWLLTPLPRKPERRDRVLIERAAQICDWYQTPKGVDPHGEELARETLRKHTLGKHALRALLRERDPEVLAQALIAELAAKLEKPGLTMQEQADAANATIRKVTPFTLQAFQVKLAELHREYSKAPSPAAAVLELEMGRTMKAAAALARGDSSGFHEAVKRA